jgi:hypothetical protein
MHLQAILDCIKGDITQIPQHFRSTMARHSLDLPEGLKNELVRHECNKLPGGNKLHTTDLKKVTLTKDHILD